jgi:hypothetical protein
MGYSSYRNRPNEFASKSSHSFIISDPEVRKFLSKCKIPQSKRSIKRDLIYELDRKKTNVRYVIAIDGSFSKACAKKEFPSSEIAFFQFGILLLDLKSLSEIEKQPFISPERISKLKNLDRIKFVLPIKNIIDDKSSSFTEFVRRTIYEFFCKEIAGEKLIETLKWLIFREFHIPENSYVLATHPVIDASNIFLKRSELSSDYLFKLDGHTVYLTDVFRLHERIDEELGASGIVGHLLSVIEQLLAVHIIKYILERKPSAFEEILFILDRPLAFYGPTAKIHSSMRELINYLQDKYNLYMVGLEKSGAFVEHAYELVKADLLKKGEYLLLSNDYIYSHILPGRASEDNIYGRTTYYSGKLIFHTNDGNINVCSIPVKDNEVILNPKKSDYKNLEAILTLVEDLKCDMFDNAVLPIALVNQLVSLSSYPGTNILERFLMNSI